jgi:arylsulfatase A-like enzyme
LAADGVAMPHAMTTACWTVPSHGSLLGGRLPRASGLERARGDGPTGFRAALQAQEDRLLPSVLGKAGYATAGVSTNLWVSEASGFDTGFDEFTTVDASRDTGIATTSIRGRLRWYLQALQARVDDGAVEVERMLRTRLANRSDRQPFFWFVNLVECHSPYLPPRPWNDLGALDRLRAARDVREHQTFAAFYKASLGGFDVEPDELERMRHLYARSVAVLDNWLARVMTVLHEAGVLDDTLVLVTSDHGENFGEGGLMGHCFSLDDRLMRVPFVASGPGADAFATDAPWSLAELPGTVADAIGLDDHPWHDELTPGIAVAELDATCDPDDPAADAVVEQLGLPPSARDRFVASFTVATDGRWKLHRYDGSGAEELVDLEVDTLELHPVRLDGAREAACETERPGALRTLRAALDRAEQGRRAAPTAAAEASAAAVDVDDLAARMELLGYL